MSEIEKLYENAGVGFQKHYVISGLDYGEEFTPYIEQTLKYPPFTADKQLRLTTFIGLHYGFQMLKNEAFDYIIATKLYVKYEYEYKGYGYGYDEAIANLINSLWQHLTKTEQGEIRKILKG